MRQAIQSSADRLIDWIESPLISAWTVDPSILVVTKSSSSTFRADPILSASSPLSKDTSMDIEIGSLLPANLLTYGLVDG